MADTSERTQDVCKLLRESFKRVLTTPEAPDCATGQREVMYQEVDSWAAYMNQQEAAIVDLQAELERVRKALNGYEDSNLGSLAETLVAQVERKDAALREARTAVGFFRSVIKSGESWSPECEVAYERAFRALVPVADQTGETRTHPYVELVGHRIATKDWDTYGLHRYCERCGCSEGAINAFGWRCATTEDQTGGESDG